MNSLFHLVLGSANIGVWVFFRERYLNFTFASLFSINKKDILFIDDNITNLMKVKEIEISGLLANWGYNSNYDRKKALKNNISPIKLIDLQSIL